MRVRRTVPGGVPGELADALAAVDRARDGWDAATPEQRAVYARWVAQPWTRGSRALRAADTAAWAAHGLLAVQIHGPDYSLLLGVLG